MSTAVSEHARNCTRRWLRAQWLRARRLYKKQHPQPQQSEAHAILTRLSNERTRARLFKVRACAPDYSSGSSQARVRGTIVAAATAAATDARTIAHQSHIIYVCVVVCQREATPTFVWSTKRLTCWRPGDYDDVDDDDGRHTGRAHKNWMLRLTCVQLWARACTRLD